MATWVIVVDDDTVNLQVAGRILSKNNIRATAVRSGRAMLDYVSKNGFPDLILLDIKMPEMDGFETLKRLRTLESSQKKEETPVIFLTADENTETENQGFEMGVSDYIRKPFDPDVLLRRINNIISKNNEIHSLKEKADTDKLTGFLNKSAAGEEMSRRCSEDTGCLMMIDLDSFKLVNDIYGHETGDRVLISFAKIISSAVPKDSSIGRVGGDEFTAFCGNMLEESEVKEFTERLNRELLESAKILMGENMDIPLGVSVGAVFVPKYGNDYDSLIKLADKMLYTVKQNGKHGYNIYSTEKLTENENTAGADINTVSAILGERSIPNVALQLDKDSFVYVYRYIMRYIVRNHKNVCKVMFTLAERNGNFAELCDKFGDHVRESLRKSDIFMRSRSDCYFVLLTDIREDSIQKVVGNVIGGWRKKYGNCLRITYQTEFIGNAPENIPDTVTVAIVDDDMINLKTAGRILKDGGFDSVALCSGKELIDYLESNTPDLILLDIKMPEMDGFETMKYLKTMKRRVASIPVIFLTADESSGAESEGLSLGAMDFITKPFKPEVFLLRVKHCIELIRLQRTLKEEVERKSEENRQLFIHAVESLAKAIDTKDMYTNGHSVRVAEYAQEIARRAGYSLQQQNDIYIMCLLHDIGKIGIPNSIINKPAKLPAEEYEEIKKHSSLGAEILENIKEMPSLSTGAKWHHERYGGGGYPDGLTGDEIPAEARIIAVADAYDAMTSKRSYRDIMSQEQVRSEIENGRGTQFDPVFADIMLKMIDEDKNYSMKEF